MRHVDTEQPVAAEVYAFLRRNGHTLVDRRDPASHLHVNIRGTAAIATMKFADSNATLVLKSLPPNAQRYASTAEDLCRLQNKVRNSDERLASSLPPLEVTGPSKQWIVMKFVRGRTLEDVLRDNRWRAWNGGTSEAREALKTLANITACIHRINPASVDLDFKSRPNATYFAHLEKHWHTSIVPKLLPAHFRKPDGLWEFLPSKFALRQTARLFLADLQPKNVIVDDEGKLHLIDPGYGSGHPAMAVGFFLNSINQLSLSYRHWVSPTTIKTYQRTFLSAYLGRVGQGVAQDLIFFYPWTLIETARLHSQRQPNLWPGLRTVYTLYMRQYLRSLESASAETREHPNARLFTGCADA